MYPLREKEVVVEFEAVIAGRLVGVQIQSRGKLKDCCLDCCPGSGLEGSSGNDREWGCCGMSNLDMQCSNGEEEIEEINIKKKLIKSQHSCIWHCFINIQDGFRVVSLSVQWPETFLGQPVNPSKQFNEELWNWSETSLNKYLKLVYANGLITFYFLDFHCAKHKHQ